MATRRNPIRGSQSINSREPPTHCVWLGGEKKGQEGEKEVEFKMKGNSLDRNCQIGKRSNVW